MADRAAGPGAMNSKDPTAALIPIHAPLEATARFVSDEVPPDREDEESFPLVVLDFQLTPEAAALFGSLVEIEADTLIWASVEVWVPLEVDVEPYLVTHVGHPVLRFLVSGASESNALVRALAFLVCVQCEPAFLSHVTHSEQFGITGGVSEDVDPTNPRMVPSMLLVNVDPVDVAYTELVAWRRAHGKRDD